MSYQLKLEARAQYSPKKKHLLDSTIWIDSKLVLISKDSMKSIFDYDPLVNEIDQLAGDGNFENQERLMTRMVEVCAKYREIDSIEIGLKNYLSAPKPDHWA